MNLRPLLVLLVFSIASIATAAPSREKKPSELIDEVLSRRPWPVVQVTGTAPGNVERSLSRAEWETRMRGMIADYQETIPDFVSPYHFLNGDFHLLEIEGDADLVKAAEPKLDDVRRAGLEALGYYPKSKYLNVSKNESGGGSGVVVDPRGYVLTAAHVVSRFQTLGVPVLVSLYGTVEQMRQDTGRAHSHPENARTGVGSIEYEAEVVGFDRGGDLALLKITTGRKLRYLPITDGSGVGEGDRVVGFAIPRGRAQEIQSWSATVTAQNHSHLEADHVFFMDYLIMPGYSGGPVCNLLGEVVGQAAALVSIRHPNIESDIPERTTVHPVHAKMRMLEAMTREPKLEGKPELAWDKGKGMRIASAPGALSKLGVAEGDVITWATIRRCDRYVEKDGALACEWEGSRGVFEVKDGEKFLANALDAAGVGGWLLVRLDRNGEEHVRQLRVE